MSRQIVLTHRARAMLKAIQDRRVQAGIGRRIEGLAKDPEKQGKPLVGELSGCRSVRAVGQRYRIVCRVEAKRVTVFVVALGIRKEGSKADIYSLARKLLRLRLL
ncbi:MAG: type II toxin-antitoxin system RelE/ParE family toxin [Nitrospirota bacterium]